MADQGSRCVDALVARHLGVVDVTGVRRVSGESVRVEVADPRVSWEALRLRFLRQLDACGMLRVVDCAREVVGLFAVPKGSDGLQRLIVD